MNSQFFLPVSQLGSQQGEKAHPSASPTR